MLKIIEYDVIGEAARLRKELESAARSQSAEIQTWVSQQLCYVGQKGVSGEEVVFLHDVRKQFEKLIRDKAKEAAKQKAADWEDRKNKKLEKKRLKEAKVKRNKANRIARGERDRLLKGKQ